MVEVEARGQYDGAAGAYDVLSGTFLKEELRSKDDDGFVYMDPSHGRRDSKGVVFLQTALRDGADCRRHFGNIDVDRLIFAGSRLREHNRREREIGTSVGVQHDLAPLYRRPLTQRHGKEVRGAMISAIARRRSPTRRRREGLRGKSCVRTVRRSVRKEGNSEQ